MSSPLTSVVRAAIVWAALFTTAVSGFAQPAASGAPFAPPAPASVTLQDAFKGIFYVGVALNRGQFTGANPEGAALVRREFNSITPENVLKWESVEPRNGEFSFALADQFVDFGVQHKLFIIGHNLCWHSQLPAWVSQPDPGHAQLTKEVLLARLRNHIVTVAGRYRGKIHGWDVVNEALNENGTLRESVFYKIIGQEYLTLAFQWAHEAAPDAELYYNDYNLDVSDAKRAGAIELVKYLRAQGAPIHGVGLQGHYNLNGPAVAKIDETIGLFAALGLKVMITELDVRVTRSASAAITGAVGAPTEGTPPAARAPGQPPPGGAPVGPPPAPLTDEEQQALAKRYAEIFAVFLKHRGEITRVTFWGLRDADSWRRSSSPLLFNDNYGRKPAYDGVISALASVAPKPSR
jgi:endo-1,4-beta-xylanase